MIIINNTTPNPSEIVDDDDDVVGGNGLGKIETDRDGGFTSGRFEWFVIKSDNVRRGSSTQELFRIRTKDGSFIMFRYLTTK